MVLWTDLLMQDCPPLNVFREFSFFSHTKNPSMVLYSFQLFRITWVHIINFLAKGERHWNILIIIILSIHKIAERAQKKIQVIAKHIMLVNLINNTRDVFFLSSRRFVHVFVCVVISIYLRTLVLIQLIEYGLLFNAYQWRIKVLEKVEYYWPRKNWTKGSGSVCLQEITSTYFTV